MIWRSGLGDVVLTLTHGHFRARLPAQAGLAASLAEALSGG